VIFEAVVVAYNPGLAVRRNQALHTESERNPEEVAAPIVDHTVVVGAVQAVHIEMEVDHTVVAVVRTEAAGAVRVDHTVVAGAVRAAHMVVEAAHTGVVVRNLAVGLDHKTWIIAPVGYSFLLFAPFKEIGNTILQVYRQTVKL